MPARLSDIMCLTLLAPASSVLPASGQVPPPPIPVHVTQQRPHHAHSWFSPMFAAELKKAGAIYVSVDGDQVIDVFTTSIPNRLIGQIANGVCAPTGLAVASDGTLYSASFYAECAAAGPNIVAYRAGSTVPEINIIDGMYDPIALAVSNDTLYASDYGHNILEYAVGRTSVKKIVYPAGAQPIGVAVDAAGALYAGYYDRPRDHIGKYNQTTHRFDNLGIVVNAPGGIAIDKDGNLIVTSQRAAGKAPGPTVDVYAPATTRPKYSFANFSDPYTVALNAAGNTLYVADIGRREIVEIAYPGGKRLGRITGFDSNMFGLAVSPPLDPAAPVGRH